MLKAWLALSVVQQDPMMHLGLSLCGAGRIVVEHGGSEASSNSVYTRNPEFYFPVQKSGVIIILVLARLREKV